MKLPEETAIRFSGDDVSRARFTGTKKTGGNNDQSERRVGPLAKEKWYFIDSGAGTPSFNMALDEVLLNRCALGDKTPVLRFYEWNPPGLSLGYFQKTKGRIDREGARRFGVGIVRRLTGGLAVLHDHELTYSVIMPEDYPGIPQTVVGAYRVLSQGLLAGFRRLHLPAELAVPVRRRREDHSPVCFEEASWYELVVGGRKAAGSAQTRRKGVILQHGSIPLSVDDNKLFACFQYPNDRVRKRMQRAFGGKAVALNDLSERQFSMEEVKSAFFHGFEEGLGVTLYRTGIDKDELTAAQRLAESKYAAESWNFSR
jgi:lipoate-protein ligase A